MARIEAASAEARHLAMGVRLLARSAHFRALVGVAGEAAAEAKIVEGWGGGYAQQESGVIAADGSSLSLPAAHGYVHAGEWIESEVALRATVSSGVLSITVYVPLPSGYSPPDVLRNALNVGGGIKADIKDNEVIAAEADLFTTGWTIALESVELALPDSFWKNYTIITLRLDWGNLS